MVLIDALYVNDSGGKILLDYLVTSLEQADVKVFYLLDKRVEGVIPPVKKSNKVQFSEASLTNRYRFYKKNKSKFDAVLCFGNLPPIIKMEAKVFTYFHNELYLKIPKESSMSFRLIFSLKRFLFRRLIHNTNFWLVQSQEVSQKVSKKFKIPIELFKIVPFYPPLEKMLIAKQVNSYVYVSNAPPHKNHIRLINAFCTFYDKFKLGKLTLTISKHFPELLNLIQEKQKNHYPIVNVGFLERKELSKLYRETEYLVYPSLTESFGLGLIEAIEADCKVIGADLSYTYAVCEPSLTFNPLDENSIIEAFTLSLEKNVQPTIAKVSNNIDELVSLLQYHENSE